MYCTFVNSPVQDFFMYVLM